MYSDIDIDIDIDIMLLHDIRITWEGLIPSSKWQICS